MNTQTNGRTETQLVPRHGVVTLFGFGIKAYVDRGHLIVEDGVGSARRRARLARVRHGLRRLVVIGSDGFVSLGAMRWLAEQDASLVMLDRVGKVLATTGPVQPSDARLRRAQALAHQSGAALEISRNLIQQKLVQQERIIRERFHDSASADLIAQTRSSQSKANTIDEVRHYEAVAAKCYWLAWRPLVINYPKNDLPRVPNHWRTFGTRQSPITGSPRRAVNPPNSVLNYLYALLQSESRLALAALGLDPGMGVLHADTPNRDSLACDLMETARPIVDTYVHDWIKSETLRRNWFFEEYDGNCRLMGPFAELLSGTAQMWQRAIAPHAEWIARTLWKRQTQLRRGPSLATRLTQARRRTAQGSDPTPPSNPDLRPPEVCLTCGLRVSRGANHCARCTGEVSRMNLLEAAKLGRIAAQSTDAAFQRANTQKNQNALRKAWDPSKNPDWLTDRTFREKIVPHLSEIPAPRIASALTISLPYATDIRNGKRIPHPRHWQSLVDLLSHRI